MSLDSQRLTVLGAERTARHARRSRRGNRPRSAGERLRRGILRVLCLAGSTFALTACGSSTPPRAAPATTSSSAPSAPSVVATPIRVAHTKLGAVGYRSLGSGPPLVLITGLSASMEDWDPTFVDQLALHHRVVVFDNAGVGQTVGLSAPLTITSMAEQTSALIDALGLGKPDVLGWSMGGMIAQALAVQHPDQVNRLILCATQAGTGKAAPIPAAASQALASGNPTSILATLFPHNQTAAVAAYTAGILEYPARPAVSSATEVAQGNAIAGWLKGDDPAGKAISGISAHTLVADGTVDALDPVSNDHQLATLIRGAQLVLYPDAGHAFLFQDQATFVPRIDSFLG